MKPEELSAESIFDRIRIAEERVRIQEDMIRELETLVKELLRTKVTGLRDNL